MEEGKKLTKMSQIRPVFLQTSELMPLVQILSASLVQIAL